MTEGQSVTAAAARTPGADAAYPSARIPPGMTAPQADMPAPSGQERPDAGPRPGGDLQVRVDARLLESAILGLRRPIAAASLPLSAPGVAEARAQRRKLLSQIDDYLLPRLREPGSPILVALVGSTGAGKSTLVNSLVGAEVSMTGIRRPTTNSPVLACHPGDVDWFAENVFLPTVPRVRQEGLARSGRDGLLVLAASEGMPKGIALLDTPDIDSVVAAHREFAHQFLDASDLWLFMTTARRYADAAVWDLLQHARDTGAALGLVLSRVPHSASAELVDHFDAMLAANGLGDRQRFVIPETVLIEGKLPPALSLPVRSWLEGTAARDERRVAVLTQTMCGVLDSFRARIPALAAQVEVQAMLRHDLTAAVEDAYRAALDEVDVSLRDGSLLRGEVLARWQDLAGTGDLLRALQARRGARQRHREGPARVESLKLALREAIVSLVISVAERAADDSITRWRDQPAGAGLLGRSAGAAIPALPPGGARPARPAGEPPDRSDGEAGTGPAARDASAVLGSRLPGLPRRAVHAVGAWQDQVVRLVRAENITKRSIARVISLDAESLATVLMVGLLGSGLPDDEGGAGVIPQRLLTSLFGAGPLRDVSVRAREDLRERIRLIFDEETLRFTEVIVNAGVPDAVVALRLYQATYALEVVR